MIEQIQLFLKDPAKVARAATIAFFLMVVIVAYFLFTLPYDLVYKGGMINSGRAAGVYAKLFVAVGLALAFCYTLIFYSQKIKKETIVYLDKKIESTSAQQASTDETQLFININAIREKIKSGSKDEKWQAGLNELCSQLKAGQGALYVVRKKGEEKTLEMKGGYALVLDEGEANPVFTWGDGLIGEVASSRKTLYLDELPEGYATRIQSGLGSALPKFLFIFPIVKENESTGVIEIATFTNMSEPLRKQVQDAGTLLSEIS